MNWQQRYRLRHAARTSLVLWAGVSLVAALVCAPFLRWLDRESEWALFGFSPDGARTVLGAVAGSMLTFIVFVLSATLIVVQLASGQLTPRIIALDRIANLLLCLGRRRLDEGIARDEDGIPRVVYGTPDWPDYVMLAVSEVRHSGAGSIQVNCRLRAMLEHLIRELPEARHRPL